MCFKNEVLYNELCKINDSLDYRVYYQKAAYEYLYLQMNELALINIQRAVELFENPLYCAHVDVNLSSTILNDLDSIQDSCPEYITKMYQLAAQLYAQSGKEKEAKALYCKYYYYLNKVKVDASLCGKESAVVYSFRPYNMYSLQDLAKGEITLIDPLKMNDPFDSLARYIAGDSERLKKNCNQRDHVKVQSECFKHFYIRSFIANKKTYSSDISILRNKLMWAYYANGHQGLCLKYRIDKDYFKHFDDSKMSFTRLIPVKYNKERRKISIYEALNTSNAFAFKDKCWEPEKEVRLLHFSPYCDDDHYSIPLDEKVKLEEIIFGFNCNKEARATIAKLAPSGCKLFEMANDEEKDIYTLIKKEFKQSE